MHLYGISMCTLFFSYITKEMQMNTQQWRHFKCEVIENRFMFSLWVAILTHLLYVELRTFWPMWCHRPSSKETDVPRQLASESNSTVVMTAGNHTTVWNHPPSIHNVLNLSHLHIPLLCKLASIRVSECQTNNKSCRSFGWLNLSKKSYCTDIFILFERKSVLVFTD